MKVLQQIAVLGALVALGGGQRSGAGEIPVVFAGLLDREVVVKGEVVEVMPPREIGKFLGKMNEAAEARPEWFEEIAKTVKPGVPWPYHENLGLTKEEYDSYLTLWGQRKMTVVPDGNVSIRLEEIEEGSWMIRVTGMGYSISTLRYNPKEDIMKSPNGPMARLDDIDSDPDTALGKWTGHEWRYTEEDSLGKTVENFAIGKTGDGKFGLLVYRLQSVSSTGRNLPGKSLLIRYPLPRK